MGDVGSAADDFRLLALRLKNTADTGLRRELDTAIRDAAEPIPARIRTGLPAYLPGRYAAVLDADLQLSLRKLTSIENPGVTLWAMNRGPRRRRKIRRLNDFGMLSHPLFGDRERWYDQTDGLKPGFFTTPAEHSAPQVREAIVAVMRDIADRVTGG